MTKISTFYGIEIEMFQSITDPSGIKPYFRARYGSTCARVAIYDGTMIDGEISARAHGLVKEWIDIRRSALDQNWRRMQNHEAPEIIEPLE